MLEFELKRLRHQASEFLTPSLPQLPFARKSPLPLILQRSPKSRVQTCSHIDIADPAGMYEEWSLYNGSFGILRVLRDDFGFPVLGVAFHVVAGRSQRHRAKDANARSSLQDHQGHVSKAGLLAITMYIIYL